MIELDVSTVRRMSLSSSPVKEMRIAISRERLRFRQLPALEFDCRFRDNSNLPRP